MKKTVLLAAFALGSLPAFGADLVDRVVARVNDGIVTESELDFRVERARKDPQAPDPSKLKIVVLEQMIRQKLIDDKASLLGISVLPEEIDEAVTRVKAQYGLTDDAQFDQALAGNGMDRAALRAQLHESLLMNKVLGREVPINLNDDAIRSEYERVKAERYATPEKARVSEILVRFDPRDGASKEAARTKIDEALARLKGGASFAETAGAVSEGPARDRGGDLGIVARGDLTAALDEAIFGTTAALTEPVELKDGWAILSIADRQKAGHRPFDDVKEELRKRMSEEIYDKKFGDYLTELRKASFVKIFDKDLAAQDEAAQKAQQGS